MSLCIVSIYSISIISLWVRDDFLKNKPRVGGSDITGKCVPGLVAVILLVVMCSVEEILIEAILVNSISLYSIPVDLIPAVVSIPVSAITGTILVAEVQAVLVSVLVEGSPNLAFAAVLAGCCASGCTTSTKIATLVVG